MSRYLEEFAEYMRDIMRITEEEKDPHRHAIMRNYVRHHGLEFSGRVDEIFAPEMSVKEPFYHIKLFTPDVVTYTGVDEIMELYKFVGDQPLILGSSRVAVGDWGVGAYETLYVFQEGRALQAAGIEVDDPGATYLRSCQLAEFWRYDSDAKLIGEDTYQITPDVITKLAPEDVITFEQQAEIARGYIDV
jgi:hypothetical protein